MNYDEMTPEDLASEAAFERSCERAWLIQAEYDPEAYDEMVREDLEGRS